MKVVSPEPSRACRQPFPPDVRNPFRRRDRGRDDPAAIFEELRDQVLLAPLPVPGSWAALMEIGTGGGVATVVVVSDGTTSLYTSSGGGVIGAGDHASVADANQAFLATIDRYRAAIPPTESFPLPLDGEIRFSVRWRDGTRGSAAAANDELASGMHALSEAFAAGHDVISAIREIDEAAP
jgi:hypothetical protein